MRGACAERCEAARPEQNDFKLSFQIYRTVYRIFIMRISVSPRARARRRSSVRTSEYKTASATQLQRAPHGHRAAWRVGGRLAGDRDWPGDRRHNVACPLPPGRAGRSAAAAWARCRWVWWCGGGGGACLSPIAPIAVAVAVAVRPPVAVAVAVVVTVAIPVAATVAVPVRLRAKARASARVRVRVGMAYRSP